MGKGTRTIRAERVEIVDKTGRVRVVLGKLGKGEGDVFGIVVRDENGRDRVWLVQDGAAAAVGLDHGGDTVASVSVGAGPPRLWLAE